jgi:hypothetical protein
MTVKRSQRWLGWLLLALAGIPPRATGERIDPIGGLARECETAFAGLGRKARAICYDVIKPHWPGPKLIVVPAGADFTQPYAIGKYEVAVVDWAKYCAMTDAC